MTATPQDSQADLEQLVTRIARRAADAVAQPIVELGTQLALARESLEGQAQALTEANRQLAEKDAELARAHQVADELRAQLAERQTVDDDPEV